MSDNSAEDNLLACRRILETVLTTMSGAKSFAGYTEFTAAVSFVQLQEIKWQVQALSAERR